MAGDEQEKTEEPTNRRKEDAVERGQVPRSQDVVSITVAIFFTATWCACAPSVASSVARSTAALFSASASAAVPSPALYRWLADRLLPATHSLVPLALALVVAAVLGNIAQGSIALSTEPLKPDISRLSPGQAAERLFSRRSLWELGKLFLKLLVIGVAMWVLLPSIIHDTLKTEAAAPTSIAVAVESTFARVSRVILGVLGCFAVVDLVWSRREYFRKLRMSRREIKDEVKQREGDPDVRSKRKRIAADLLRQSRSLARVPEADIVLTNPTHVAIAVQYRRRTMRSPIVLSKGAGDLATEIRRIAIRKGVPILRSPELARALFRDGGIEQPIPGRLQQQLVPIYRWVMSRPGHRVFS